MSRDLVSPRRRAEVLSPGEEPSSLAKPAASSPQVIETWYQVIEREDPAPSLRKPVVAGMAAILLGFGGFFGWAWSADLDSASIASGSVIVDTKRKTVTHFEGGILKGLLVKEGDLVKIGQPLLLLDDTRARTELAQLSAKRVGLLAKLARLRAEQRGAAEIEFPQELIDSSDPFAADVMAAEKRLFAQRTDTIKGKIGAQRKLIEQHGAEAEAAASQFEAAETQRSMMEEQADKIRALVDKGYAKRTTLLEFEAKASEFAGDAGEYRANKARAEQAKAGAEIDILSLQTQWQSDIATELQAAQLELSEVIEKITAARDVMKRVQVTAPQEGIVANIQTRTPGGVVPAGQPIMDIVPENERLIIEAKLDPRDIEAVHVDSKVQVKLTAYNQRTATPLDGRLSYVAADQTVDERSGNAYYVVRAEIYDEALRKNPTIAMRPGMPADVMIINRPRKAIDYLIAPIADSFNRAFHED